MQNGYCTFKRENGRQAIYLHNNQALEISARVLKLSENGIQTYIDGEEVIVPGFSTLDCEVKPMTEKEYELQSKRVKQYSITKSEIDRLEFERGKINNGVLSIQTFYQATVDCGGRYDGYQDGVRNVLLEFYDKEIARLEAELEKI